MTLEQRLLEAVELKLLRPLDVQFALMVAQNEHPAVMLAAAMLSRDTGEGHVCLPLSHLNPAMQPKGRSRELWQQLFADAGAPDDWAALLLASQAVSDGESPLPLILSGERLYLNRMWHNELTVARFFSDTQAPFSIDEPQLTATLNTLFPPSSTVDWQKVAAAVALTRRISVVSGGPGTGKTTTVAKLLAALVQMAGAQKCRIRLAAPTGLSLIHI